MKIRQFYGPATADQAQRKLADLEDEQNGLEQQLQQAQHSLAGVRPAASALSRARILSPASEFSRVRPNSPARARILSRAPKFFRSSLPRGTGPTHVYAGENGTSATMSTDPCEPSGLA